MGIDRIDAILDDALADDLDEVGRSATAGAMQAAVVERGEVLYARSSGRTRLDREGAPVTDETPLDIASLSKPLVVGTLLMQAADAGALSWDEPVWSTLPNWNHSPAAPEITWEQLANHTAGLPDWLPLYRDLPPDPPPETLPENRDEVAERIRDADLDAAPGDRECYSDLGYIVLGWALEALADAPLDRLADTRIFGALGLEQTRFVSARRGDAPLSPVVATERQSDRGGIISGRVHDRNAAALGGVAGHAGCFSTALDLARLADHLLAIDSGATPSDPLVERETLRYCWSDTARGGHGHHLIGWDTPSGSPSSAGRGFQAGHTVGHLGFTGTSIWLERDRGLAAVLLTNRVHPSRDNDRIKPFRIRFHEAIVAP